jgi:glutathione synthase/RimK-type ligase-like ATP-grasp enzyme
MSTITKTCRGIYREPDHSPGRIDDDRAIMDCVGQALTVHGFSVELVEADAAFDTRCANIFAMCERGAVLDRLADAQNAGSVVVNSPNAIRNTYRHRMIELFAKHHVASPASHVVASHAKGLPPAAAVWVKRYDFHATQPSDVIYVASEAGWHEALERFAKRGIPFIIAQEHAAGDLVKFYGVRNEASPASANWFEWFYHRDQGMLGHSFAASHLRDAAFDAAGVLGLEVFGGDAVIREDGKPMIIDINAWPSYARYRERAAQAIASHLAERFERRVRIVSRQGVES